ncbi:ParA family protein [Microbacterium imperiale]|uniref:ParA family protein n=1 Tax=Microbacterium imperiale TaxID=33884 RepID=UPI001AE8A114|nr:ParA family protein [Microbacterium imperiale]MBP2422213.1 chromosome partitioning protein [Microbacterium imperiale]MDS0200690.1 ParA family protein [Microbacterium imperiale]
MIILFGGTKGGPGKSTVALNLGVALAAGGARVLFIDADKQRTLAKWHARRIEAGHEPRMTLVEKRGNLHAAIRDLSENFDHVLVDVAGDDNEEMRTAMTIADQLIVVLRASQFDAETLEEFSDVITAAKNFNPKLVARALFSQVPTYNGETETEDVSEYVREFPELTALGSVIAYRKIFRDSVADGRGVLEMPSKSASQGAAKSELRKLVQEVMA